LKGTYFKELDGVRAIAALMVMFFHFFQGIGPGNSSLNLIKSISVFGQTGVSLFFVLSGFLITRILLQTKADRNYFSNFYLRRALRIFPLYYLFLVIYYFIIPLAVHTNIPDFRLQFYYWIYLQNIAVTFNWQSVGPGHFWSLAVEEHFYFIWPLLIYYLNRKKIKLAVISVIGISIVARILLLENNYSVFYFTLTRMDELALGAFLALLEQENKLVRANAKKFLLLLIVMVIPSTVIWTIYTGQNNTVIQVLKFLLLGVSYFSLIGFITCTDKRHWSKKLLTLPAFTYTGKISYGLYVYHPLCFFWLETFIKVDSVILNLILNFIATYLVATVSFYLFEERILRLKKHFTYATRRTMVKA
jgi:peptidoglycan/LPS O-acetylase OafA/YrhL